MPIPRPSGQPVRRSNNTNTSSNDNPAIASGKTKGAARVTSNTVRPQNRPNRAATYPAAVPTAKASVADKAATRKDNNAASINAVSASNTRYQRVENPDHAVTERLSLKPNTIRKAMGR